MNWKKDQCKINLIIDGILLILLTMMAGLGLFIKFVLVPGFKRNALYGSDVELYFWGLDRHQWGGIHLYISIAFLALILLHIILHWKMIICIFRKIVQGKLSRKIIGTGLGIIAILLIGGPLIISPEVVPIQIGNTSHSSTANYRDVIITNTHNPAPIIEETSTDKTQQNSNQKLRRDHFFSSLEIDGNMTIDEVCAKYSIPVMKLTEELGIPATVSSTRIGRLKRAYSFEMEDLKNAVVKIKHPYSK